MRAVWGVNSMLQFDYVWFYPKGPWGFDAVSVAAFREDLLGADEGLRLVAHGSRPARTIHFWDYYEDYYGRRLAPADWGLSSWADYVPRYGTQAEKDLHVALISYEWLRQGQRFGDWTAKYCYGAPQDGFLRLEIGDDLTDVIYYGEDTPAFRAFLAEVKSDRPLTAKFFK